MWPYSQENTDMVRLLAEDQLKNKGPERTAISCIFANSPRNNTDLPVSHTAHQISLIKSRLWAFRCFNLEFIPFCPQIWISLIHSSVSGVFLQVYHHWQRLCQHHNHKSKLWWSVLHIRIYIIYNLYINVLNNSRVCVCGVGWGWVGCWYSGRV